MPFAIMKQLTAQGIELSMTVTRRRSASTGKSSSAPHMMSGLTASLIIMSNQVRRIISNTRPMRGMSSVPPSASSATAVAAPETSFIVSSSTKCIGTCASAASTPAMHDRTSGFLPRRRHMEARLVSESLPFSASSPAPIEST